MVDKPVRVLLVDDEVELVSHLQKRLKARGLAVATATSGDEAIEVADAETFDVAVVDLKMPGLDGLETLARLKELQPMMYAIMLTGHGSFEAAHESGKHDAYRFLTKPHDFDALLAVIEEAAETKRKAQQEGYQRELAELVGSSHSPREIMAETERLRKKYDI